MTKELKTIIYPSTEKIEEYNLLILTIVQVKKADKAEVLSYQKIEDTVERCKKLKGDIYDKAVFLLKSLVQKHAFASGNRRTAFIVAKDFLIKNHCKFKIEDNSENSKVMLGIRENFYTDSEIKRWLEHGKIREFRR
ncbi:MAG: type II toxin-antitoxin system death-on-curing family toxin [Candidatus Aenigmarchaeota archaeon]|nr:type II toxin-antitoxin system death-on-curing family toxin [Candidatus Aenigmarchaeota archaeon]